jgi:hypothetical protein
MITEERKKEMADNFAAQIERYIDKQWIDTTVKEGIGNNKEEEEWLTHSLSLSVITHY